MGGFKPKSIEELNAAFEQKLHEEQEEKIQKELEQKDSAISEEQKNFYFTESEGEPEAEAQKETKEEEPEKEIEEEAAEEKIEQPSQNEEPEEEIKAQDSEEEQTPPEEMNSQSDETEAQADLFEAERLSQEKTELFEADNIRRQEAEAVAAVAETEEAIDREREEQAEKDETMPNNVLFFKKLEPAEEEENSVKLEDTSKEKGEKKEKKKRDNRKAKTVLNTLIALFAIICIFINGLIFVADMPKRFVFGYGATVCTSDVAGSNVKKNMLIITKKAKMAPDNKVVCALKDNKKVIVDFKQNIGEDSEMYSKAVKIIPQVGRAVTHMRGYWLEYGCAETAVLLALLIARVGLSEKKEKTNTNKAKSKK